MKFIALCFLAVFVLAFQASAQSPEAIQNFKVEITVNQDATINVVENISFDFGDTSRHGIYRDILVKYKARGGNYNLRITDIDVLQNGLPAAFKVSNSSSNKQIKIGDPDRFVSGAVDYQISYRIGRAINFFSDYDELYWNVTGNNWQVPIFSAFATVNLPKQTNQSQIQAQCFAGPYGTSVACSGMSDLSFSQSRLNPGEGLTIVVE